MGKQHYQELLCKSAAVITWYQQPSGAYPASPYFAPYQYTWFRDGAFTADAMSRAGDISSAERFFEWCSRVVLERRDGLYNGQLLNARYTYDGSEPSEENWAATQLDGYGVLLWAIKQHERRHERSIEKYKPLTDTLQWYLETHWQEPCYDWWEERLGAHPATLACVYAGLAAFGNPLAPEVRSHINVDNQRVDASMLACVLFDAISKERVTELLSCVEATLVSEVGGVYRYKDDTYYGGGEWPVLTALLGVCYVKTGRQDDARLKLEWCARAMQGNGWLPEQVASQMLSPDTHRYWVERWGQPASPLLWSQAMMVILIDEYMKP